MRELKEIYYFGSFNPFHYGHKLVAICVSDHFSGCKVHITPSPCSPMKNKNDMLPIDIRMKVIETSLKSYVRSSKYNLDISDIDIVVGEGKETHYTYETLEVIKKNYNGDSKDIGILLGSDELAIFDKWKNWKWIYDNFTIVVYPRRGDDIESLLEKFPDVELGTAKNDADPYLYFDYSSTEVRNMLKNFDENIDILRTIYFDETLDILKLAYNG